ncbi:cerebellin-1-like [Ruditapes philippinarum]|uniref:cerebellin-1-like n=1 Tax=Ruditapes philippinarum TaxID=129788 RepID=UPI00295BCCB4|nr:cerebellin-1-like [Ruditapes philippinarum]
MACLIDFDRLLSDSQHKVATGTTEDAYTEPLFNRTRNNTDFFNKRVDNKRVKRQEGDNIAFSAYVDHEVRFMGKDQTVQFENVPLNEGNGFNNYTGVFTVPRSGVYMLIFFVEDFHDFQSIFHLVVNKNIVSSAIADPIPEGQNIQGGNVVLVHLNAGESVWVSAAVAGDDIEGYSTLRTSTFSGYLVYE